MKPPHVNARSTPSYLKTYLSITKNYENKKFLLKFIWIYFKVLTKINALKTITAQCTSLDKSWKWVKSSSSNRLAMFFIISYLKCIFLFPSSCNRCFLMHFDWTLQNYAKISLSENRRKISPLKCLR